MVAGDGHDVVQSGLFAPAAHAGVVAVSLVGGEPLNVGTGIEQPFQHPLSEFGFGLDLRTDSGFRTAFLIMGPGHREAELAVDQRPAFGRDAGQENPELAGSRSARQYRSAGAAPTDLPFFRNPVSSVTAIAPRSLRLSSTEERTPTRAASASHR
ncbi:hypothetical protein QMK34_09695 [Amycolatopsis sp. H20-H5]|nr:hypothetical protein [Amycolatopsis sp. H20-H5]MEC3975552.1 hypothetical protein [Amycolatopsis sp. H20-H5]